MKRKVDTLHPLDGGKVKAAYTRHPAPLTDRSYRPTAPRTVRKARK